MQFTLIEICQDGRNYYNLEVIIHEACQLLWVLFVFHEEDETALN